MASEAALFAYLLFAYFYLGATAGPGWCWSRTPRLRSPCPIPLLLLASSPVAWWGERGVLTRRRAQALLGFGAAACRWEPSSRCVQLHEWHSKHFGFGTSSYGSLYFLTTGLHEAHVIVGILILVSSFCGRRSTTSVPGGVSRFPPACCTGTSWMGSGCLCSPPTTSRRTWGSGVDMGLNRRALAAQPIPVRSRCLRRPRPGSSEISWAMPWQLSRVFPGSALGAPAPHWAWTQAGLFGLAVLCLLVRSAASRPR